MPCSAPDFELNACFVHNYKLNASPVGPTRQHHVFGAGKVLAVLYIGVTGTVLYFVYPSSPFYLYPSFLSSHAALGMVQDLVTLLFALHGQS